MVSKTMFAFLVFIVSIAVEVVNAVLNRKFDIESIVIPVWWASISMFVIHFGLVQP